jgi:hypothetical protein
MNGKPATAEKTGKVLIEGEPAIVEAILAQMKKYFEVTYQSKTQPVPLTAKVRCHLYLLPLPLGDPMGEETQS